MASGIDYGRGMTNIDYKSGIRFGVLNQSAILQAWADSSEGIYPDPEPCECETCGGSGTIIDPSTLEESSDGPIGEECECSDCDGTGSVESDGMDDMIEPLGFIYKSKGIFAHCGEDGDIFVEKSPFYTLARFCSPCAPGACYLRSPDSDGAQAYCFPEDWFDGDFPCPYPVYSVKDHSLVFVPEGWYKVEDGEGNTIAVRSPK